MNKEKNKFMCALVNCETQCFTCSEDQKCDIKWVGSRKEVKETRGGANRGQGRKSPFKEKTKGVKFMCPISKVEELKKHVNTQLLKWSKGGI